MKTDMKRHRRQLLRWLIAVIVIALFGAAAQAQQDNSLPKVKGLQATEVTHDSITITWEAAPEAHAYFFFLKGHEVNEGTKLTTFTFTGLKPEKKYNIRVRYILHWDDPNFGASRWSKKISVTTKAYIPPPTPAPPPPVANLPIRASIKDSCSEPNTRWYAFEFDPVPDAVEYHVYRYTNPDLGKSKSVIDSLDGWFRCARAMPEVGLTLTVDVEAYNADGYMIAAGSVSVTNPYG